MNPAANEEQNLKKYWDRKSGMEMGREKADPKKQIHTDLIWREIARLIGNRTDLKILDAGGGPGRFSIPLAQKGHEIVHMDISQDMIQFAKDRAANLKGKPITFIHQSICRPLPFLDNSFDLVLCLDSPLSYCVSNYEQAFAELLRVSKEFVLLCVVNKLGAMLEDAGEFDLTFYGRLKTQKSLYETGTLDVNEEMRGFMPTLMPSWHAFTVAEMRELVNQHNGQIRRLMAPGTFARFMNHDLLEKLICHPAEYEEFLLFMEDFDQNADILGVGASGAGGLLVSIEK